MHTKVILSQLRAKTWSIAWPAASESHRERRGVKRALRRQEGLGATLRTLSLRPAALLSLKWAVLAATTKARAIYEAHLYENTKEGQATWPFLER